MNNDLTQTKKEISIAEASRILKVSTKTLRRWEQKGLLIPHRSYGNHRRYWEDQIYNFKDLKAGNQKFAFQKVSKRFEILRKIKSQAEFEYLKSLDALYPHLPFSPKKLARGFALLICLVFLVSLGIRNKNLLITPFKAISDSFTNRIQKDFPYLATTLNLKKVVQNQNGPEVLALNTEFQEQDFNVFVKTNIKDDLTVDGGDIDTSSEVFNFINTSPTQINIGGQSNQISIGSTEGTTTINNNLLVSGTNNDIAGTLNLSGNSLTSSTDLRINPTGGGTSIGDGIAGTIDLADGDLFISGDLEVDGISYIPTLSINSDNFTDLTGSGLQISSGSLETTLGTSIDSSEIADDTIKEVDLNISNSATSGYSLTYNSSTGGFTWTDLTASSTPGWTDDGTLVRLTTSTDNTTIGSATELAKLGIDGDTDEIQLLVQGNSTQTNNLFVIENSSGTDLLTVNNSGDVIFAGSISVNSDVISDPTGNGLTLSGASLTINLPTATNALSSTTSSGSGLEVLSSGLTLLQGCANGEILKWNETSDIWECSTDTGGAAAVVNIENNDVAVGASVDTVDFTTDFSVTASPANEANVSIANDILDFTEFTDSLTLDAATDIALGALTLSTSGTGALDFNSTGQVSFAGNVDAENGLDVTGASLTIGGANASITTAGAITLASTISAIANETINGIDISSGTVSDVVNLTINSGGDLTIGSIGLNDVGTSNTDSGASLVGVFDEFANSSSTTVQDVLDDLDAAIGAGASKWTDSGTLTYLTGTTDSITIGSTTELGKLAVDGDTDEIQLIIQGNATQTSNLATFENSSGSDVLGINNFGDLISGFTALNGSSTTNASGTTTTSLVLTAGGGTDFDAGNYVQITSTDCSGTVDVCYSKIRNKSSDTLTLFNSLSWAAGATVVEYHVPEVGATNTAETLTNRYGQGFFISGTVAGNGSTYYSDQAIFTSNTTSAASPSLAISTGTTTTSGNSGNITIDTGSAASTAGTITIGGTNASGVTIGRSGTTTTIGGSLTINGQAFADLTGTGLNITTNTLHFDCSEVEGTDIDCSGENITLESTVDSISTLNLAGTGTLNGLDAIDATGEDTIEALIFDTDAESISGVWTVADSTNFRIGTGGDLTFAHDGTNTTFTSITGDLIIDNTLATGSTIFDLGTDTSATDLLVRNNSGTQLFSVNGAGSVQIGANGQDGQLVLYNELGSTDYTNTFNPSGSQGANIAYTLPPDDGTNDYVLKTDGSGVLTWVDVTSVGGAGDITAVGNITSGAAFTSAVPGSSLYFATGGDLLDANGNELIQLTTTASAVNELTLANAATGGNPTWTLTGGDTDISLSTLLKAAGSSLFSSTTANTDTIAIKPQTTTATNSFTGTLTSADLTSSNKTWTFPDATGTVCLTSGNCVGVGGSGDVIGPGSSTDNAIARFDGTTGKLIQNSGITIDDSDNVITSGTLTAGTNETLNGIDISSGAVSDVSDLALVLGASNDFTIDATTTDSTGTAGIIDLDLDSTSSQQAINLDIETITDAAADTLIGLDILATQTSTDDDVVYGLRVQNLGGTADAGNEYAIYQAGTAWDFGLYVEDAAHFNTAVNVVSTLDARGDISDSTGNLTLNDAVDISGITTATGNINANGGLDIDDAFVIADGGVLTTSQTSNFDGSVDVDGAADFAGGLTNSAGELLVSGGNLQLNDSLNLTIGTGDDLTLVHNGTNTLITNTTGDLIIDNTLATGSIIFDLGTDTTATDLLIRNNSGTQLFSVNGAGTLQIGSNGQDGQLVLYNELGTTDYSVTFNPSGSQSQDTTYTLPVDDGTDNYVLTTNGSGLLAWESVTGIGGGDVTGPGSSTDNAIARFDGTTGKVVQNSAITIDDSGNLVTSGTLTAATDETLNGIDISSGAVSDVSDLALLLGASNDLTIDAAATDNTTTSGVFDLNVDTITTGNIGLNIDHIIRDSAGITAYGARINQTIDSDASESSTGYGLYITADNDDASSTITGLFVDADGDGGGTGTAYAAAFVDGFVGIGTSAPSAPLYIGTSAGNSSTGAITSSYVSSYTGGSTQVANNFSVQIIDSSASAYAGARGNAQTGSSGAFNAAGLSGIQGSVLSQGASGTITTAQGGMFTLSNTGGGSITNGYGLQVATLSNSGSGIISNARGINIASIANSGGGSITSAYGLYINSQTAGTNSYGLWADGGDWILDEDGGGTAGGTTTGGDIILGEGQDLELYHDGTNSNIVNNTGSLNLTTTSNLAIDAATSVSLDGDTSILLADGGTTYATLTQSGTQDFQIDAGGGNVIIANGDVLDVYGTTIGLNNDADANNVLSYSSAAGGSAAADLYWGDDLVCDVSETNCGWTTSASSFTGFDITDGSTTEGIASGDAITFADSSTVNAAVSTTDTVTMNVIANSLDFAHLENTLDLDATTDINLGASNLTIDLDSSGIFDIRDGATTYWSFDDDSTVDVTFPAAGLLAIDAATTDNTGTAGIIDINLDSAPAGDASQSGINIDVETITDTASVDTIVGLDILATQTSTDNDIVYGLRIQDLGGTPDSGNEYGIYQAGTAWDFGLYVEDTAHFNSTLNLVSTFDARGDISDSTGNLTLNDAIDISGITTATGNINANGGLDIDDAFVVADGGVLTTSQTANFDGAADFDGNVLISDTDIAFDGASTTFTTTGAFTLTPGGSVLFGDGGDTLQINSSDWDISTTGDLTGIGAITANGAYTTSTGTSTAIDLTRTAAGQWISFNDGTDTWGLYNTAGSPEGALAANTGALSMDTTNGTLYVKTDDTDNTGWVNLATGGSSPWTNGTNITYLTDEAEDLVVGSDDSDLVAPFSIDVSANLVRIGDGADANATLAMYASDGATGSIAYTTGDEWNFTGGGINLDSYLDLDSTSATAFTLGDGTNNYITFDGSTDASDTLLTINSASSGITGGIGLSVLSDTQTTGTGQLLSVDALTTGTGLLIDNAANTLTTGSLLQIQSTATSLTTAADAFLGYYNWAPGSATSASGDLFGINIGANGNVTNLFNVTDAGSTLFRVTENRIQSAVPHEFTASGDVSLAYDLNFTNQTASTIDSSGPLTIRAGEVFENNNLTLKAYGTGSVVIDGGLSLNSQTAFTANDTTPSVSAGSHFVTANSSGTVITAFDDGAAGQLLVVEINDANTDFDCTSNANFNCGGADLTTPAAGDIFTWIYDGSVWNLINWMDASATQTGADLAEWYPAEPGNSPSFGEIVSIGNPLNEDHDAFIVQKSSKAYDDKAIGIVSSNAYITMGQEILEWTQTAVPVALAGRVHVKVDPSSSAINPGDKITSSDTPGLAQKATGSGYTLGKALGSWDPQGSSNTVLIFVENSIQIPETGIADSQTTEELVNNVSELTSLVNTNSVSLESIELLLNDIETNQNLLEEALNWDVENNHGDVSVTNLGVENLYVTSLATVESLSVKKSIVVGNDLVINSLMSENPLESINSIDSLNAPLAIQGSGSQPLSIMAGKLNIDTSGNVSIAGNLTVEGSVSATLVTTEKLVLSSTEGNENQDTNSEISSASIGTGILKAGESSVSIQTTAITNKSLIYITPTSSTLNKVLYLKGKIACNEIVEGETNTAEETGCTPNFLVGVDGVLPSDVEFNWWIVDVYTN